jgi:hypothetical protein
MKEFFQTVVEVEGLITEQVYLESIFHVELFVNTLLNILLQEYGNRN